MAQPSKSVDQSFLNGLNKAQLEAVTHLDGPALVIAGAGSGKTKVITSRIAYLIERQAARPEEVLALTFTDKAATEMEERVDQLLPYGYVETQIMTFHALGSLIIKDFTVEAGLALQSRLASPLQQHVLMRHCLETMTELVLFRPIHNPHQYMEVLLSYISRLKDEGIDPDSFVALINGLQKAPSDIPDTIDINQYKEVARIYTEYEAYKTAQGFIDFGDQLLVPYMLMRDQEHVRAAIQARYRYILVDEFQDTNTVQAQLLYLIAQAHKNIMVVGDDDQSIYRFRGAELKNILNFQNYFPEVKNIVLTENYRSTQQIIDVSYTLIQHNNPDRLETKLGIQKRLRAQSRGPVPEVVELPDIQQELSYVVERVTKFLTTMSAQDIVILTRSNRQVGVIARALEQKGIAVGTIQARSLLHQPVVRQCIDFLRVLHDLDDSSALYRFLLSPKVGVDPQQLMQLAGFARREHTTLQAYLMNHPSDVPADIAEAIVSLEHFRKLAVDQTAGEVLYQFVTSDGYLDGLVLAATEDPPVAQEVHALAKFFRLVGELEELDGLRDTESIWSHVQDMYALSILAEPEEMEMKEGVQVLTMHRAKGLEFEAVIVFDVTEGTFPSQRRSEALFLPQQIIGSDLGSLSLSHIQEERRLCYVALTRAKKHLVVTYSPDHGGKRQRKPSRFIVEAFGTALPQVQMSESGRPAMIEGFAPAVASTQLPSFGQTSDGWMKLTPNQIAEYLDDPHRFYVHNILQFPEPPSHRLIYGTAVHGALEYYFRERLSGRAPQLKPMQEVFASLWQNQGFVSKRHEQERFTTGMKTLQRLWSEYEAQEFRVRAVEEPFEMKLEALKVRIKGRIDLVLQRQKGVEIRDFKTSAVSSVRHAADRVRDNLPLNLYALAWGNIQQEPVEAISLQFVDAGVVSERSKINNDKTIKKITEAVTGIRKGHFPSKARFTNLEIDDLR